MVKDNDMKIKFYRHAKRRGKLYKISEETVKSILEGERFISRQS